MKEPQNLIFFSQNDAETDLLIIYDVKQNAHFTRHIEIPSAMIEGFVRTCNGIVYIVTSPEYKLDKSSQLGLSHHYFAEMQGSSFAKRCDRNYTFLNDTTDMLLVCNKGLEFVLLIGCETGLECELYSPKTDTWYIIDELSVEKVSKGASFL